MALLALVWLPAVVKVVALTGGRLKTGGTEASTSGLIATALRALSPEAKREALPSVIAAVDSAAILDPSQRARARELGEELQAELAGVELGRENSRERLAEYARRYEAVRDDQAPGSDRTYDMNVLVAKIRAVLSAKPLRENEVRELSMTDRPGDRLIAIVALQDNPRRDCFDVILDGIENSRSAFEQFHALLAADAVVETLGRRERTQLSESLMRTLKDPEKGIQQDASRYRLIRDLLAALELHDR